MLYNRIKNMLSRIISLESSIGQPVYWADYVDTALTPAAPLALAANTRTVVPNNGLSGPRINEGPVPLYNPANNTVTGINGETRLITIEFTIKPTAAGTTYADIDFDIGGTIGAIYKNTLSFPKGTNVERQYSKTFLVYTLGTWEANGATLNIETNGPAELYNHRVVVRRN